MLTINSSNNAMYLKLYCQKVDSTINGKLRRLSGRFQTLMWRPGEINGSKSGVSRDIRES